MIVIAILYGIFEIIYNLILSSFIVPFVVWSFLGKVIFV
jgi:hypothetical protein